MRKSGSAVRRATSNGHSSRRAISADGQRVAYNRVGPEGDRIWITPVAGGPPVQLAPGNLSQDWPSWSPDGAWVTYDQYPSSGLAKMRVGARTPPELVTSDLVPASGGAQWSPDGSWLAYNGHAGLSIVSPDGKSTRVLHEQPWLAYTWSADSQQVYGIRQSDDYKHLSFTSVDIRTGAEHLLSENVLPLPISQQPVRGFTRVSLTTFITSILHVRSDVWLLEGFQPRTLWDRLTSLVHFFKR